MKRSSARRPATVGPGVCRSGGRPTCPGAGPTAATAARAATSGWWPTATWPRCWPSGTTRTAGPRTASTARARRSTAPPGDRPRRPGARGHPGQGPGRHPARRPRPPRRPLAGRRGRPGRAGQRPLPVATGAGRRPSPSRARWARSVWFELELKLHGRRRAGRVPQRGQEHADLPHLGGQAQDRRLPLHHARAEPRRGPHRRRRVRGGRHPRPHRGRRRGPGPRPPVPAPHRAGPGADHPLSTWRRPTASRSPTSSGSCSTSSSATSPTSSTVPGWWSGSRADLIDPADAPDGMELLISSVTGQGLDELVGPGRDAGGRGPGRAAGRGRGVRGPPSCCTDPGPSAFDIDREDDGTFVVDGREAARAVALSDLTDVEALEVAHGRLKRLGVDRALARAGAEAGDTVRIGGLAFDYEPEELSRVIVVVKIGTSSITDRARGARPDGHRQALRRGGASCAPPATRSSSSPRGPSPPACPRSASAPRTGPATP